MKINFKRTPEQVELVKRMGSKDLNVAAEAKQTFAELLAPIVGRVFNQADTTSFWLKELQFDEFTDPSLPVDPYLGVGLNEYSVWSQTSPGGLARNEIFRPLQEVKFDMYNLSSAVSYLKKYERQGRLDVVARGIERAIQEILVKRQVQAWSVGLAALANAVHNGNKHVYRVATAGSLVLDDLNSLLTYFRRLNQSFAGGTPVGGSAKPTDAIVSPEIMGQLRALAYNPINTKGSNSITGTAASGVIALTDEDRKNIYRTGGVPEFFGISLLELLEFGIGQSYNSLFSLYAGSTAYTTFAGAGSAAFNPATTELLMFLDATQEFAWRAVSTTSDSGGALQLLPDDQYTARSGRSGWYMGIDEGVLVSNSRAVAGLIV